MCIRDRDSIAWYESFSFWKLAIIAQQLYKRYLDGATKDPRMAFFGKVVEVIAERGRMDFLICGCAD